MAPELHLHPERLLGHAAAASGLSDELQAVLRGAPADVDASGEVERLRAVVGASARAFAELTAALAAAAASASAAEAEVAGSFARLRDALGPPA